MEVNVQAISVADSLCYADAKERRDANAKERLQQMMELQERRRSLQALLSSRLAELRRVCLQEAELTGQLPSDFPLGEGEPRHPVRSTRLLLHREEAQLSRRKTLFSGAMKNHTDKKTVHRGCHTGTVNNDLPLVVPDSTAGLYSELKARKSDSFQDNQLCAPQSRDSSSSGPGQSAGTGCQQEQGLRGVLMDYVWGKHKLQRQRSHGNPTESRTGSTKPIGPPVQPDPHPHLLPPRPPRLPLQRSLPGEATRSLHKALALEGLRDWYLRNTFQVSSVGGAQRKPQTVTQPSTNQTGTRHQYTLLPRQHKHTHLAHSATFHGSIQDGSLYQDVHLKDQSSPGTLV